MLKRGLFIIILAAAFLASGCIVPPERPKPPRPGKRLAAKRLPGKKILPKDLWKKEIKKMGVEALALNPEFFAAFPDQRTVHEITKIFYYEYKMSDRWLKEIVTDRNLAAKWEKELTTYLEENSIDYLDGDRKQLKDWKKRQSPPWPEPKEPDE
ncbi:MAG: hypothetical protein E3J72_20410 [Planctomycetota bacterium]|nr:MAG: hypothetical protein E3J72_20410 [Planctomycetota bacterium]